MIKLLAILGFILCLTSPALANHLKLEHGRAITSHVVSCGTEDTAREFTSSLIKVTKIKRQHLNNNEVEILANNLNCKFEKQYYVFTNENYVCGFTLIQIEFTLLNIEVEGIRQFTVVPFGLNDGKIFAQCNSI